MKHEYHQCNCDSALCMFCRGNLKMCNVCGGFEGSLPTECPGEDMPDEYEQAVFENVLDFVDGEWRKIK